MPDTRTTAETSKAVARSGQPRGTKTRPGWDWCIWDDPQHRRQTASPLEAPLHLTSEGREWLAAYLTDIAECII
jgi:hypothetical protein